MLQSADEGALRRATRDIIAISSLPTIWANHSAKQVADSFVETLHRSLALEFSYIQIVDGANVLETAYGKRGFLTPDGLQNLKRALKPWLKPEHPQNLSFEIPNPLGETGNLTVNLSTIGHNFKNGVLITAASRSPYPVESDRLLLNIASNQAKVTIQHKWAHDKAEALLSVSLNNETQVKHAHEIAEQERSKLESIFETSPAFMALLRGPDFVFEKVNARYYELVGHREIIGKKVLEALPEIANQGYIELLTKVFETGETYSGSELEVTLQRTPDAEPELRYVDLVYQRIVDLDGVSIFAHGFDVTEKVLARKAVEDSARTLDQIFSGSPSFMAFLRGPEFVFEQANAEYAKIIGKPNFLGKRVIDVLPEVESQGIIDLLTSVYKTKKPFVGKEIPIRLENTVDGSRQVYVDFVYQAMTDFDGEVYGIACQGYDVTEKVLSRKTVEQAKLEIENERENFRNLFKQTPEMVCILKGPEHVFEFVNEAHIKTLGFDAAGKTVREAQPESVEVFDLLDSVYRTGKTVELNEIPVTVSDRLRYFNITYCARRDISGKIDGVMVLATEVTEQVLSRQTLEKTARLIESMPAPFFAMNGRWEVVYWNPAAVEVIGLPKEKVVGKVLWDVFPGLEDSIFGESYKLALAQKTTQNFEAHYSHYDKWYQVWSFPFEDGVAVTFLDLTARKVIEQDLKRSQERYKVLFDGSPLPKWTIDLDDFRFIDVNRSAIEHYGYSKEEFLSMKATDIRPKEDVARFLEVMKHSYPADNIVPQRLRHQKKSGEIIEVEVSAVDLTLDTKRVRIAAAVDITDRVKAESQTRELMESLNAAKVEAERANELKSAFLANMSHEIRTPLGAMMGFADLLRDRNLSETERTNYTNILSRNGEQLSVIINDILDLSKVEAGHLSLEFSEVSPAQIANEVISLLTVKAKEKNLKLELDIEKETPSVMVSDSTRVRQVLLNLVSNAIKFTQFGSVKVKIYGRVNSKGKPALCFEVIDTGIGINKAHHDRIFEVFVQADGSMTRRFGGTGLGLALSRRLARALGGDVSILESKENQGSRFLFEIEDQPNRLNALSTVRKEEFSSEVALTDNILSGTKVLVVDDAPDNQQLIGRFLKKYGAVVESAEDGNQGCKKALAGNHDIVLMDIQMPEMDGYTATQKLREAGYQKPIIALTAHAMDEVRKKCLDIGCTDHITKPINSKNLVQTVARYTHQKLASVVL